MPDVTVFISYRRADTSADAGRLYDALRRRFGRDSLFMDVDSLQPGQDWVEVIGEAVNKCDVLLALIGPDWSDVSDDTGQRRLDNEFDRVRLEIEAALKADKAVIPVLFEDAPMPHASGLPDSLQPLVRRHAIRISHATFDADLRALLRALKIIGQAKEEEAAPEAATPKAVAPNPADQKPADESPAPTPPPAATTLAAAIAATAAAATPPPAATPVVETKPPPAPPPPPTQAAVPPPPPAPGTYVMPPPVMPGAAPVPGGQPEPGGIDRRILFIGAGVLVAVVLLVAGVAAFGRPSPTATPPTFAPTLNPTFLPTLGPTSIPTLGPTAGPTVGPSAGATPNIGSDPTYGEVILAPGFQPDPQTVNVMTSSAVDLDSLGAACTGFAGVAPDYRIRYSATGGTLLRFFVQGTGDTTLAINGPTGQWFCGDDEAGLNPMVDFAAPAAGRYDIYVGSYAGTPTPAVMTITSRSDVVPPG